MRFDYLANETEKSLAPFFSPRMLAITFNCVLILGLLLMVLWPQKDPFKFVEEHKIPLIFLVIFVAVLLINSYINLRCARGEISQADFFTRRERREVITFEQEYDFFSYGLVESLLHTIFLLLLMLPLLIASATISGISLRLFIKALSILFTSSLLCRMFGFLMYLRYGKWSRVGYLSTRMFFIFFIFATGFLAAFANPILLIHSFYKGEEILCRFPMSAYSLHMMIVTSVILILALANQAMVRRHMHREKST